MAKPLRPKRGTTAQNDSFTGLPYEITLDKDKHSLRIHDGVTAGGHEILPNCLPLSGGTMSGNVKFNQNSATLYKNTNDGSIIIRGGGNGYAYGASLSVYGKEHATSTGQFALIAHDGTNTSSLVGKPDGTLNWGGRTVLTNANGLPLSGGTMTGSLKTSFEEFIRSTTNDSGVRIYGGNGYGNGSYVALRGKDYSEKGIFTLCASDGTNSRLLKGSPDGSLTWNNNNVITSAGGVFTGVVNFASNIRSNSSDGMLDIQGGITWGQGAYINLYAQNHASKPSAFEIHARNMSTGKWSILYGAPDGTLKWGGKNLTHVVETWKSGNNWYRKWSDGWIEQGGIVAYSSVASGTVTFNTAFTSKPTVSWAPACTSHGEFTLSAINTSNFTWKINADRTGEISWYACGY